jgi:hypothetical protein
VFGAFVTLGLPGCSSVAPVDYQPKPPTVADFPEAPQSLVFSGQLTVQVSTARPFGCASAIGPSGPLYEYGADFYDAAGGLFQFTVLTDPKAEPYRGPGTYHPRATLIAPSANGKRPTDYEGKVRFVVIHDPLTGRLPQGPRSPNTGTVEGILSDAQGYAVQVSGGWTCVPSMLTGPG